MKKRLRFLFSVAATAAMWPAVAHADPISAAAAAIVSFAGMTSTAAAVATFVVQGVLYSAGSATRARFIAPRSSK